MLGIAKKSAAVLMLALFASSPLSAFPAKASLSASVKVTRTPPETIKSEVAYDTATKRLDIRCVAATRGSCRIIVANGSRQQVVLLKPGQSTALVGVLPSARTCTRGLNPQASCAWTPVLN